MADKDWTGRRVWICFDYDTANRQSGTIVRDFGDTPTVIQLDTGRIVFGTECQWTLQK